MISVLTTGTNQGMITLLIWTTSWATLPISILNFTWLTAPAEAFLLGQLLNILVPKPEKSILLKGTFAFAERSNLNVRNAFLFILSIWIVSINCAPHICRLNCPVIGMPNIESLL